MLSIAHRGSRPYSNSFVGLTAAFFGSHNIVVDGGCPFHRCPRLERGLEEERLTSNMTIEGVREGTANWRAYKSQSTSMTNGVLTLINE